MATIDFATFLGFIDHVLDARFPVLIRGRHGVGKSEVVYQTAARRGLDVVERRASQMTEGDLLGLPDTSDLSDGRKATTWNAPDWLVTACTEPVVLFLDEVDRATMEVRQGLFELTDSRKINGWHLHPGTLVLAAVNGGENGAQYQVGEMDPAELDRWTVYDIEPSVEDWLNWANGKVDPVLWDFINAERAHLEHGGEHEPNKVYPSRRSWVRFNGVGTSANVFKQGADLNVLFNLAMGFVGFEAAIKLRDFVSNYQHQVSIEDLIDKGQIDRTSSWGINDHSAMVEKLTASGIFSEADWSQDRIVNLAEYFIALPSEVALKLWAVMGAANNISLVKAIHPLIADQIVKLIKVES